MIIDAHTHPLDEALDRIEAMERFVELMDECGVEQAVSLGPVTVFGPDPSEDEIRRCNELTIELASRWPKRLIGYCYVNPAHRESFLLDQIEESTRAGGLRGVKLWVAVNARDARMEPVMQLAEELEIPVLIHAWYKTVGRVHNESSPADVHVLASRHPRVRIIMAHLTACGYRGVLDVKDDANVYLDTSGSQPYRGVLEFAVSRLGPHRILFGSDAPIRDLHVQLARIYDSDIDPEHKRLILGENMRALLGAR